MMLSLHSDGFWHHLIIYQPEGVALLEFGQILFNGWTTEEALEA